MKQNFCTLFDSNYLSRGVALYNSLSEHANDFHLFVFAFDEKAFEVLRELSLRNVTVISLKEFEDEKLLHVKPLRTAAEYCWTCTPSIIRYAINKFGLSACTYLDADLFFYNDPSVLINEMGTKSVLITRHRYTPQYDQSSTSGIYCVQFMTFRNDEKGMTVLNWWREACIDWCYARLENGKFGDQKYLDDWTTRFDGVHELRHLGGGLAPWNIQQYSIQRGGDPLLLKENRSGEKFKPVFFHFHYLKFFQDEIVKLTGDYLISHDFVRVFYIPYVNKLISINNELNLRWPGLNSNGAGTSCPHKPYDIKDKIHIYKNAFSSFKRGEVRKAYVHIHTHNYFYLNQLI
jgi:hypothetical protein